MEMPKVWAVIEEYSYESTHVYAVFPSEDEANELVKLIEESKQNRMTHDGLVQCPFGADEYHVEEWEMSPETPEEMVIRLQSEQMVQVERMREVRASPEFQRTKRLAEEKMVSQSHS